MRGIFVTLKDIQNVYGYSRNGASVKLKAVKDSLGKKKNLTVREFCQSEEIPLAEFYEAVSGKNNHK